MVTAGNWVIKPHVFRDHPERGLSAAEVKGAILGSFEIAFEAAPATYRVTGPGRLPGKLVCIVAIEEGAVVVTVWRRVR